MHRAPTLASLLAVAILIPALIMAVKDIRHISYEDAQESLEKFQSHEVRRFGELLFDIPRYQLIVGARDYLFRLSLEGLRKLEEVHWPAEDSTKTTCVKKGQSEADCRNFIKVLSSHNNKIFSCGTNAFSPECTWREVNALNTVTKWVSGVARCPYSPHFNSTALVTVSGDYYIASPLDFSSRDQAIHRITNREESSLRTVQYDSKWLGSPDFVASFEIGNFTYFFFREEAVEYLNCGKTVYSRVARVCKNDQGGRYMLKDNWTTFLKARLNCSVPGIRQTFYYDHIQSVHYLEQEQMLYATFNTPDNSIYGSAICAYNISAISRAFNGPFKYQSSSKSAWEKASVDHRHFQCDLDKPSKQPISSSSFEIDAQRYQLMFDAVQSAYQQPVYTAELQRLNHIVVDVVATKHQPDGVHVIFVSTVEGLLRKLVVLPQKWTTCLVEEIQLFPSNSSTRIYSMKILKDLASIYLGTEKEVMRVRVHRCKRYLSKESCLNAMDPYCGWYEQQLACTTAPHRNPQNVNWLQNKLTGCPRTDLKQDGGWSVWSPWHDCSQTGLDVVGDRCLCHKRECENPPPANGGKACVGNSVELTNCTRNGQWTQWSSWSACSASCGPAVKTRRRACGNPSPAFGGRVCVGPERDEVYCTSNPPCPANVGETVDGQWSDWGTWEECSQTCGGGTQMRRRKCNSPEPRGGGRECTGCHQETRVCNTLRCPEAHKTSPWSPWLRANETKDGYFEQRFRFLCKVTVPDAAQIRFGPIKREQRFCSNDNRSCMDSAYVNTDGEWSEWASWSRCSLSCGSGLQFRERACDNPRPSGSGDECPGINRQERECNTHACQDGWMEWSVWSLCDSQREQHRRRICSNTAAPSGLTCQGANKETRICIDYQISSEMTPSLSESRSTSLDDDGIHIPHLVAAALCGFFVGCVGTAAVLYFFYYKRRLRPRGMGGIPFRPSSSKPNHYVPESEYKNNYNAANDFIKPKEATIKRNGTGSIISHGSQHSNRSPVRESIRANLEMDNIF